MSEYLVILRINIQDQVEAVKAPLSLIARLRRCVAEIIAPSAAGYSAGHVRALSAASADILCLVSDSMNDSQIFTRLAVGTCALAVQALCVATLSFGQAHIGVIDPFFMKY